MPWGWECKARLVKQVPVKPTEWIAQETTSPGPNHYEPPKIIGGNGFSNIKRAPAYSFGRVLKPIFPKSISPNAPIFNVRGISEKGGGYKIPGGLLTSKNELPDSKMKVPGPGTHDPDMRTQFKREPAYSMRPAVKPPYQPFDSWTPPANMYCPPIPKAFGCKGYRCQRIVVIKLTRIRFTNTVRGNGFSNIKRAPAYSFGRVLKPIFPKSISPNAPIFNVRGISEKGGGYKIPGGLLTSKNELPDSKMKVPGPGTHDPDMRTQFKREPAYSMRPAVKPPYQPFDSWTPPANMYCPPIPKARAPAFTFGYKDKASWLASARLPGPGEYNPNYNFVRRKKPAYSFGPRFRSRGHEESPAPNAYCDKMFMVNRPSIPAPSFGIRHSPFLGKETVHLKPSGLELRINQV